MRRFTKPEDLKGLEDIHATIPDPLEEQHLSIPQDIAQEALHHPSFTPIEHHYDTSHSTAEASAPTSSSTVRHSDGYSERSRRYLDANTSFLNSADTEGSGYIPDYSQRHYPGVSSHALHPGNLPSLLYSQTSQPSSAARTPVHYPASLVDEEVGLTAPGTPLSFASSPSIGYYSHPSRPSSRMGLWVDQAASSLNLIMPTSAMFVKTREPTADGDKMGFLKMMVAGRSRVWNLKLIRELFKWEGIIANEFDDEFLKAQEVTHEQDGAGGSSDMSSADVDPNHRSQQLQNHNEQQPQERHQQDLSSGVESRSSQASEPSVEWNRRRSHRQQQQHQTTATADALMERYASTTVLPVWARAGMDEQDMHQEILVKNICIVDTPGYASFTNTQRAMDLVVSYLGVQFQATNEFFSRSAMSDDSLGRFLANNTTGAHSHVDLCLYVIENELTEQDIQFISRLHPFVNILPVLIQSSLSHGAKSPMNVTAARQEIIRQLREHEIHIYGMGAQDKACEQQSASPLSTGMTMEDEQLSPPPLVLDPLADIAQLFTSPPFVLNFANEGVTEERLSDTAVQQLDIRVQSSQGDPATRRHSSEATSQSRAPSVDTKGQLDVIRHWIYHENLPALRHHTTLKFLSWRRRLPLIANHTPMASSLEAGSVHQHRGQSMQLMYPDIGEYATGSSFLATFSATSTNKSSPPASVAADLAHSQHQQRQEHSYHHPQRQQQRALPSNGLAQLHAQDRQRLSAKASQMLEPYRVVFERILLERQDAWQMALRGLEREQRIEFLVQEIKRWATESSAHQSQHQPPLETGGREELDLSYRHMVGLGLRPVNAHSGPSSHGGRPPSLRDALDATDQTQRESSLLLDQQLSAQEEDEHEHEHGDDPLGLSLMMGRLLGALGRGLVQLIVMIGMGSFATWIYTHFLEHRVMWI
ncbi:hypothetical protein BG004_006626 [Podila humilis]|nr:hypothetical protein BG004_006626 [Podila humilis]